MRDTRPHVGTLTSSVVQCLAQSPSPSGRKRLRSYDPCSREAVPENYCQRLGPGGAVTKNRNISPYAARELRHPEGSTQVVHGCCTTWSKNDCPLGGGEQSPGKSGTDETGSGLRSQASWQGGLLHHPRFQRPADPCLKTLDSVI
jgi:hypothetical protein